MQRSVRSQVFPPQAAQSLCFHPLPESQPVLPCLLRRLLQKGRYDDALELARWAIVFRDCSTLLQAGVCVVHACGGLASGDGG